MGKKKKLDDLKNENDKDLKPVKKIDLKKLFGGKGDKKKKWNNGAGGILPQ